MNEGKDASEERYDCAVCGERDATMTIEEQVFSYGESELRVLLPVFHCDQVGLSYTDEIGEALRASAVKRHLGGTVPMTAPLPVGYSQCPLHSLLGRLLTAYRAHARGGWDQSLVSEVEGYFACGGPRGHVCPMCRAGQAPPPVPA